MNMLLELLAQVLQEPCFDTLRTKEQLGMCCRERLVQPLLSLKPCSLSIAN